MTDLSRNGILHRGLYEVHLPVTDLERSMHFYIDRLGFTLGFGERTDPGVLLVHPDGAAAPMLGLYRVESIEHRHPAEFHTAFRVPEADVDRMIPWLEERSIQPLHPPTAPEQGPMAEPIVHGWMPAAAVFFRDPDGHLLELIAELSEAPRPEFGYRPLGEWRETGPSPSRCEPPPLRR